MQATFGRHLFMADKIVGPMIRKIDDNRRLQQSVCLEASEYATDDLVVTADRIMVLGH